jgi:hypothetical protein
MMNKSNPEIFIFLKPTQKDKLLYYERKKIHPLLGALSVDWKTLDGIQTAETHTFAKVIFKIYYFGITT